MAIRTVKDIIQDNEIMENEVAMDRMVRETGGLKAIRSSTTEKPGKGNFQTEGTVIQSGLKLAMLS